MVEPALGSLPATTIASQPFWTSGAGGVLRLPKCTACGALRHPSLPVCGGCHSDATELAALSGEGVVVGCTVNHQPWSPSFPPPYVIAMVALDEDPGVRLTTNIVGCEPDAVFVGMRVKVRFEQRADVWIPLFEPLPGAAPGAVPEDEDPAPLVRPMRTLDKFEDRVVISGIGQSQIGRRLMVDPLTLTVQACLRAIEDAGLRLQDIDGLSSYPGPGTPGHSEGGVSLVEEALRVRPTWINGAPETPGQSGSIVTAMLAVASGLCRHVLCFRTVWEATHAALVRSGQMREPGRRAGGMMEFRAPFGAMSAANWIGMNATNYFHRYGVGREMLGWIALNARANAARNPDAVYRAPLTMDEYLSARMVSTPFGLYDCDVPCDGAVAVIVSAAETAGDLRKKPVRVEAVGTQIVERVSWDQGTLSHEPQVVGPAAHLWSRTSLRQKDVDVAELYDGFTFNTISWLEGLGFCGWGEATGFLDGGRTIALDGSLPLNTHGGQLSAGRTHGYGFVHEAVVQLRGEGGERQVRGAKVAAVSTGGGTPGGALLLRVD